MKKITSEELRTALSHFDCGGCWFYTDSKNKILFLDDKVGSVDGPFLEIQILKDYVKILRGLQLTNKELKTTFPYNQFEYIEQLAECLSSWVGKYFNSFKIQYVRNN